MNVAIQARLRLATLTRGLAVVAAQGAVPCQAPFSVAFTVPRLLTRVVRVEREGVRLTDRGHASLHVLFPSARGAVALVDGGRGALVPWASGRGALRAAGFLRAALGELPRLVKEGPLELRARLLLWGAVESLSVVGSYDPAMAPRLLHARDGVVRVEVVGTPIRASLVKEGARLRIRDHDPEPNTILAFRDLETAVGVFSGALPTASALAGAAVTLRGYLPLVQALFSVFDRLPHYKA